MRKFPQVMINVPIKGQFNLDQMPEVADAVKAAEQQLADTGRVLLRPSGTEPLIRVMVEGSSIDQVSDLAKQIAAVVEQVAS